MGPGLTNLDKDRIEKLKLLNEELRWRTSHIVNKKAPDIINDLVFLLNNKHSIGTLSEMVGREKLQELLKLIAVDLGIEQSVLTPDIVVSLIEENRVLSEIVSKKNKVWRDLVAQVNSAKELEDFVSKITEKDNVYLVDGERTRVHIRR